MIFLWRAYIGPRVYSHDGRVRPTFEPIVSLGTKVLLEPKPYGVARNVHTASH